MMDLYGRAVFTAELRLRGKILGQIRKDNWAPTEAFEVPSPNSHSAVPIKVECITSPIEKGNL